MVEKSCGEVIPLKQAEREREILAVLLIDRLQNQSLFNEQKAVLGELFGSYAVRTIIPDGEKIARIPGVGETGIDDIYRVNRPNVDYVIIEYKFVGNHTTNGSSRLKNTADGRQGSDNWLLGGNRLPESAGRENAVQIEDAIKQGRTETWVVTTRPNGATEIQILDPFGKPQNIDTSTLLPSNNLSGAKP